MLAALMACSAGLPGSTCLNWEQRQGPFLHRAAAKRGYKAHVEAARNQVADRVSSQLPLMMIVGLIK